MIVAAVLASGFSRRMGRSKLTLEIGGRTFLERAVGAVVEARRVERCLVVVRPEDESLVAGLHLPRTEALVNPRAVEGQSAAVRLVAVRLAADPRCEAALFSVVDQPLLDGRVFDALTEAWEAGCGEILVASYGGRRGNPVLFSRRFFPELANLHGDVGGREVLGRHPDLVAEVEMPDPRAGQDVDTWEEFLRLQSASTGERQPA